MRACMTMVGMALGGRRLRRKKGLIFEKRKQQLLPSVIRAQRQIGPRTKRVKVFSLFFQN
jgi:hypothetical protein